MEKKQDLPLLKASKILDNTFILAKGGNLDFKH